MRKPFFFGMACASAIGSFAACVGDDPVSAPPAPDASPDTSAIADAADSSSDTGADAGASCNVEAPFTTVERVSEFSTSNGDYGLSFSGDGLSAYVSTGTGSQAILVHTRLSTNAPFGGALPLNGLPNDSHNYSPTITPDGKELFFAHRALATGETDIYRAEIGGGGATNAAPAPGLNDPDAGVGDESPHLVNERVLYFARIAAPQGYRIFRAERATTALPFSSIVAVSGLGTFASEANPVVTADELHIYFAASEEDAGPTGFTRVMRASRPNANVPFNAAVAVDNLNVPDGRDGPLWISPDRCMLYFFSDREKVGLNDPDIWVAKRTP